MDERVRDRVFRHILDWCGTGKEALSPSLDSLQPAEQALEVLKAALVARYGREEGLRAFEGLE